MCRLFGMTAGGAPVRATFWLLEAPDSLARQSRQNPDGYGLATHDDDRAFCVEKDTAPAYADERFAREAVERESPTFVAHVRYSSQGVVSLVNTHPFEQKGRVFAHNGHIGEMPTLEAHLDGYTGMVRGDTDSERFFALITKEIDASRGDVGEGIVAAVRWVARELPLFSLNFVLATPTELWALRYPDAHPLMMLERASGGWSGDNRLDAASAARTLRVRSSALQTRPSVIFASEPMDSDPDWKMLKPGELVRVGDDLRVCSRVVLNRPPARQIRLEDLEPQAAASQGPSSAPRSSDAVGT